MSNRLGLRASALVFALASLAGCSSVDEPEPAPPCNDLVNDGPAVTPVLRTAGTTPMGGTIDDGRYAQTGFDYYPDEGETLQSDPRTLSSIFEFSQGSLEVVVGASAGGQSDGERFSTSYAASGTTLTLTYSCPNSIVERPEFTATPSELRLFYRIAEETGTAEIILTKQ
jgi:hypothetical protein